jgi:DNA-binding NarL/FixJ family response regulator
MSKSRREFLTLTSMATLGVAALSRIHLRKPQQQARLVIIDDCEGIRYSLQRMLEAQPDMKVIGAVSNTAEAMKLVRQFKPDILTTDLCRPEDSGFDTLRALNETPVKVIMVTAHSLKSEIVEALQLGARGYVVKPFAVEVLLKAIRTVMADGYWVDREQVSSVAQYLGDEARRRRDAARWLREVEAWRKKFGLTPRELEIVSLVVAGYSDKEIPKSYYISYYAVKHHLRNILHKLGVSTQLELALFAVNQGLPIEPIG